MANCHTNSHGCLHLLSKPRHFLPYNETIPWISTNILEVVRSTETAHTIQFISVGNSCCFVLVILENFGSCLSEFPCRIQIKRQHAKSFVRQPNTVEVITHGWRDYSSCSLSLPFSVHSSAHSPCYISNLDNVIDILKNCSVNQENVEWQLWQLQCNTLPYWLATLTCSYRTQFHDRWNGWLFSSTWVAIKYHSTSSYMPTIICVDLRCYIEEDTVWTKFILNFTKQWQNWFI